MKFICPICSSVKTGYVTIVAALYNDQGKFVGVTYDQVQETLNPKNSVAFQTEGYNFTDKIEGLVDKYEVFAYTYEYPRGVAGEVTEQKNSCLSCRGTGTFLLDMYTYRDLFLEEAIDSHLTYLSSSLEL